MSRMSEIDVDLTAAAISAVQHANCRTAEDLDQVLIWQGRFVCGAAYTYLAGTKGEERTEILTMYLDRAFEKLGSKIMPQMIPW